MPGLMDIAVVKETVKVGKIDVEIQGISVADIAQLMGRFPALRALFNGDAVDVSSIIGMGDQIVGAIIASGCGMKGDEAAEKHAAGLEINTQVDLLTAIIHRTMPGGFGPLAEKIRNIGSLFGVSSVVEEVAPRTASQLNSHAA